MKLEENFLFQIFAIVAEIPEGQVATYGQIAQLAGLPHYARQVGNALHRSSSYGDFPCHRVVNSQGRTVPYWKEQRSLLEKEGITFRKNGTIDLTKYQWNA